MCRAVCMASEQPKRWTVPGRLLSLSFKPTLPYLLIGVGTGTLQTEFPLGQLAWPL